MIELIDILINAMGRLVDAIFDVFFMLLASMISAFDNVFRNTPILLAALIFFTWLYVVGSHAFVPRIRI